MPLLLNITLKPLDSPSLLPLLEMYPICRFRLYSHFLIQSQTPLASTNFLSLDQGCRANEIQLSATNVLIGSGLVAHFCFLAHEAHSKNTMKDSQAYTEFAILN